MIHSSVARCACNQYTKVRSILVKSLSNRHYVLVTFLPSTGHSWTLKWRTQKDYISTTFHPSYPGNKQQNNTANKEKKKEKKRKKKTARTFFTSEKKKVRKQHSITFEWVRYILDCTLSLIIIIMIMFPSLHFSTQSVFLSFHITGVWNLKPRSSILSFSSLMHLHSSFPKVMLSCFYVCLSVHF